MLDNSDENLESAILFQTKDDALEQLTLSDHVYRLNAMSKFLFNAIEHNQKNLTKLRQVSKTQTSELKNSYQMLQSQTKEELERLKNLFQPAMNIEKRQLADMKTEVGKINSEQLSTKKVTINCEAMIDHCENQMGFIELKGKVNRR